MVKSHCKTSTTEIPGSTPRDTNLQITSQSRVLADEVCSSWKHQGLAQEYKNSLGTPRSAERPGNVIPERPSIKRWIVDRMTKGRHDDDDAFITVRSSLVPLIEGLCDVDRRWGEE